MITIYQLDDILALRDGDKITAEIEKHGFRQVGDAGQYEFDHTILINESAYKKSAIQTDELANKEYYATLYSYNKVYKGYTFISFTIFAIIREHNNVSIPKMSILFTDAPYNAEYVREMNSPYKCEKCGAEYIKKTLLTYDGKFLCDKCFCNEMDRKSAELLAEKIIEMNWLS